MRHVRIDPAEDPSTERPAGAAGVSVRERMSRPAVTVAADAPLAEALGLMAANRIHYLPVVDGEARLVGIVNADDVLQTRRARRPPAVVVGAVMSTPVISVGATSPLTDAMGLMADRRIGALPVVENGRVVGILTQSDVVTAVARQESA
jgi:acetoin utilization protein AcuB